MSLYFPTFLQGLNHDSLRLFPPTENEKRCKLNFMSTDDFHRFGV